MGSTGAFGEAALAALEREEEGLLLDADDRHPGLIESAVREAQLTLTSERLEIIHFIRDYFEISLNVPEALTPLRHMRGTWGEEKATRRYLYRLFPPG